ncbi:MAG TPA: hypothetical protein PKN32_04915 [Bacteroidales bacterium]|nr:hypothetical protein [Bacteroidales bacterium]
MNREQFNIYSSDFSLLNSESLENIRLLLEEFPYFQSAWILYVKNLHILKDVRFESKLKTAAVYIPDRRILKRIINDTYIPGNKVKNDSLQENIDFDSIITESIGKSTEEILIIPKITSAKSNIYFKKGDQNVEKIEIEDKELINFDFEGESALKNEEILSANNENIVIEEASQSKINELNKPDKAKLIDKFLESDPRIIPEKEYLSDGSAANSLILSEDDGLFSETLAKIYASQEHFDKAILTYEKLCLKYPEKSIYFAGQIEKIKELIKNKRN